MHFTGSHLLVGRGTNRFRGTYTAANVGPHTWHCHLHWHMCWHIEQSAPSPSLTAGHVQRLRLTDVCCCLLAVQISALHCNSAKGKQMKQQRCVSSCCRHTSSVMQPPQPLQAAITASVHSPSSNRSRGSRRQLDKRRQKLLLQKRAVVKLRQQAV